MTTKTSKKQLGNVDTNPIEQQISQGVSVIKQAIKDEAQAEINTLWRQLLRPTKEMTKEDIKQPVNEGPVKTGDLSEGEELIFSKQEIQPAIDYVNEILHSQEKTTQKENQELRVKIEEITIELKKLSKSSKELELTFRDVDVETLPQAPGKYHLNFFEWILITIRNTRMRVEESASWIGVVSGKKAKKDYWALAKKHGTSYMLSGERVVAQQVG
jgi:hypothetical protein